MAAYKEAPADATAAQKLLNWVDNRFPLSKLYNEHMGEYYACLLYTSPSPRDRQKSRMPSSA